MFHQNTMHLVEKQRKTCISISTKTAVIMLNTFVEIDNVFNHECVILNQMQNPNKNKNMYYNKFQLKQLLI